jgi:hypothetical protein
MAANTKAAEDGTPAGALDMCWMISKTKELKSETFSAQRPTSNAQFRAQKLNVERSALSVGR